MRLCALTHVPLCSAQFGWVVPACLAVIVTAFVARRTNEVYLLDFAVFDAPEEWRISRAELLKIVANTGRHEKSFTDEDVAFMQKVTKSRPSIPENYVRLLPRCL
jgi:hypothetical protein